MSEVLKTSFEATGIESGWAQAVRTGCTLDWDSTTVARPAGGGAQTLKSISTKASYSGSILWVVSVSGSSTCTYWW